MKNKSFTMPNANVGLNRLGHSEMAVGHILLPISGR